MGQYVSIACITRRGERRWFRRECCAQALAYGFCAWCRDHEYHHCHGRVVAIEQRTQELQDLAQVLGSAPAMLDLDPKRFNVKETDFWSSARLPVEGGKLAAIFLRW